MGAEAILAFAFAINTSLFLSLSFKLSATEQKMAVCKMYTELVNVTGPLFDYIVDGQRKKEHLGTTAHHTVSHRSTAKRKKAIETRDEQRKNNIIIREESISALLIKL